MAPHSSTLAWKIPWTEEPGGLQSMGSLRFRNDWATSLSLFTFMHWRRKWQPTPVFLPGESQGRGGAWWAAIYGVAQSRTWLKRLSSSSSFQWNSYSICSTLGDITIHIQVKSQMWKSFLTPFFSFAHYFQSMINEFLPLNISWINLYLFVLAAIAQGQALINSHLTCKDQLIPKSFSMLQLGFFFFNTNMTLLHSCIKLFHSSLLSSQ